MTGAETAPAGRTPALRSREIVNSRSSSLAPDTRADRLRGRGDLGLGGESLPCMRGAHVDAARGHGRLAFHRGEAVRTATAAPVHVRPRPKALPPKPPLLARTTRRAFAIAAWCSPSGSCCSSAAASPRNISALFCPTTSPTDSARSATILERRFGDPSDGEYLLVFATRRPLTPSSRAQLQAAVGRAVSKKRRRGPARRAPGSSPVLRHGRRPARPRTREGRYDRAAPRPSHAGWCACLGKRTGRDPARPRPGLQG